MIKTIRKMGNSQGLIFDQALCELTGLKVGDEVNVVAHEDGTVTLTPLRRRGCTKFVTGMIRRTVADYAKTLKKLA
jgi:antitoxin component of MazEF toxin-antitoxin module